MTDCVIDQFAGPGGWEEGLRQARADTETVGLELDAMACATAEAAGQTRIMGDLTEWHPGKGAGVDGLISSPPCGPFAQAGPGAGKPDIAMLLAAIRAMSTSNADPVIAKARTLAEHSLSTLVLEPMRYILALRPTWIMLEQVPGVLPAWHAYAERLQLGGYSTWVDKVRSEQYGVPQVRERAVLLASLEVDVSAGPTPTHSKYHRQSPSKHDVGTAPWVTMAEALQRPPRPAIPGETAADCQWVYDRPSPTIVGSYHPEVVAAPGYRKPGDPPRQRTPRSVLVTPAEAGVLQSFPADYPWQGTEAQQFLQIGNAVPPLMAAALYRTVKGIS